MTTVRLPAELEKELKSFSQASKKSKSEIIKEALCLYMEKQKSEYCSYELGEELFGQYGSGRTDLSSNYKQILKEKLHAKFNTD